MSEAPSAKKPSGTLNFVLDFGPLFLFFVASKFGSSDTDPKQGAIVGTAAFMAAILVAVIVSKLKLGKIFGALTIWFHDERFIQIKPTIIYAFFATLLLGGWFRGKAMLKYVLEQAYQGLDEKGWMKLSLSWGIFFFILAGLNEIFRRPEWFSFDTWLSIKVWGVSALTFLFALANIPMLMRHGLKLGDDAELPPPA
jgi:intracellular septation protein